MIPVNTLAKNKKHLMELPEAATKCYQLYTNGAAFKENATYADWEMFGKLVFVFGGAMMWYVGDWLNFGEKKFGEKYTQALEITKYDYGTLRNCAYVSGRYELKDRRQGLSWRHHADCARFELGDRTAILDMAEKQDMSSTQLREFLHRQFPTEYKKLSDAPAKTFDTWWPRYAQTLPVQHAQDVDIISIAKDAWRAGQKVLDSQSV